jgi:hypothetical protein
MFLRTGCMLPDGIDLRQEQFCEKWMSVEDTTASALDVRSATRVGTSCGLQGAHFRFAAGGTAESALYARQIQQGA